MGGPSGRVHCWDLDTFRYNIGWLSESSDSVRLVNRALALAEFVDGMPAETVFLWIEPKCTQNLGLSKEGRKALRVAVGTIKQILLEKGYLPENITRLSRIHQLDLFRGRL